MKKSNQKKDGYKKSNLSQKKEFEITVKRFFDKIKPGLEKGKCLVKDGLVNLSDEDRNLIHEQDDAIFLVMLTIMIQAYPKNTFEFEGDKEILFMYVKCLESLINLSILLKLKMVDIMYNSNKIDIDFFEKAQYLEDLKVIRP